jgi:tetratricopeptide (TPR) repeat protein
MKVNVALLIVTLMAILFVSEVMAQENAVKTEKLGTVHFPVSCSPAAQEQFNRAVALLHSFWVEESEREFTAVTENDPSCAMGYWGIAMSLLGNPLPDPGRIRAWKKGWMAIGKANSLGTKSERERDYIAAIEMMYRDPESRDARTRTLAYEKAMEQLYLRYPEDREAAIFYALALNITVLPADNTYANQLKAGAILETIFAEQPNHPGVAHYIIHSYDYPPLASRGLTAARRYAQIAPSASHALHMPSHIFTQLGMWQESIQSNIASGAMTREVGNDPSHGMHFLIYAYLQGAQDVKAKQVLDELNAIQKGGGIGRQTGFAAMPARYVLERRAWSEAASLEPPPDLQPAAEAITYFARALGSVRSGNAANAQKAIEKLQSLREALLKTKENVWWADQMEIERRAATAWVTRLGGKNDEALKLMRSAADLEDSLEIIVSTPAPFVFARELLSEMLLELNQPREALKEFEASLDRQPNRFHGLYGAARAAELSGNREKAKTYYAKLVEICEKADTERAELKQVKAFLAKK